MQDSQGFERHATGLVRRLGTFSAMMVVVAAMIGSGVFKKVAPMSAELGASGWVLAAWILAGLVTLAGALTNAEIAGLIAEPGGQYKYFERMYGRFFAYLYGWTQFAVVLSATVASVSYVFAQSVNSLVTLPRLSPEFEHISILGLFTPLENLGVKALTILLIAGLTAINYRGVQYASMVSNVLSSAVVVCIVAIIVLGFSLGGGGGISFETAGTPIQQVGLYAPFFTAMMAAFWAYEGWNSLGFLGGEVLEPQRTIPRALTLGVGLVMGLYVAVNAAYLWVLPTADLAALTRQDNAIAAVAVVSQFLGQAGTAFILSLIIVATFSSANNSLMVAPRVYFAMALDGNFFASAKQVNKAGVPGKAMLIQSIWASLLVLSGSFDQLTDMLVFAAFMFYGAGAVGLFVLRRKMPDAQRDFKVPLYPVLPAVFIVFCLALVVVSIQERPREAFIGAMLIGLGVPFYWWFKRNQSKG